MWQACANQRKTTNRAFIASLLGDQTLRAFPQAEIKCAVGAKRISTRYDMVYQRLVVSANRALGAESAIRSGFASLQLD